MRALAIAVVVAALAGCGGDDSGGGTAGEVEAAAEPFHGQAQSVELALPPLGALVLAPV